MFLHNPNLRLIGTALPTNRTGLGSTYVKWKLLGFKKGDRPNTYAARFQGTLKRGGHIQGVVSTVLTVSKGEMTLDDTHYFPVHSREFSQFETVKQGDLLAVTYNNDTIALARDLLVRREELKRAFADRFAIELQEFAF